MVHLPYIAKYETDFTGKILITLRLKPVPEVVVSKEKAAGFKKWLGERKQIKHLRKKKPLRRRALAFFQQGLGV